MADLKDIINLIEKREKADKQSKPLEEWISTEEGKTVVDSLPVEERSFLKDIFNTYQGSNLSKVLGAVKKLSPDEIRIGISKDFNKGGMPKMQEQMDLFEQGGLKDEGGMKDPVSGNKVPVGSTRKEVRDDIPAMVSEGEFIFPADVTRYIGLDKLMQLRQDAKRGLAKMEQMGQMGGSPIEEKDELPFTSNDIVILSESGDLQEFDEGGMPRNLKTLDRNSNFYSSPEYINWVNSGGMGTTDMYTSKDGNVFTSGTVGRMYDNWLAGQSMGNKTDSVSKRITFKDVMGENQIFFKEYRDATGNSITISFIGNAPLQPIPEGYTYYDPNNPDDHPSSNISDATPPTENFLVELSPDGDGAYNDAGEWIGQGSAAQMARDKVDTASMTNTEFANHVTKVNGKGRNIISAVLGLVNPVMGLVTHTATAYNDRALQKEMESRLAKTDLSAEDRAAITAALEVTKTRLGGKLTSTILGIVDELASTFNLTPQEVEEVKKELAQQNETVNTTINNVDPAVKSIAEVVNEVTAKYREEKDIARKQSGQTGGLPVVPQTLTGRELTNITETPTTVTPQLNEADRRRQLAERLPIQGPVLAGQSLDAKPIDVAASINQKSLPTAVFNPVTGQLESKTAFDPVAPPTFDQLVSDKTAASRPIDRIDPTLGMPMDASMVDLSSIKNIDPTLGVPLDPTGGMGFIPDDTTPSLTDDYGNTFTRSAEDRAAIQNQLDMYNLGYGPQQEYGMTGFGGGYQPVSEPSIAPAAGAGYDIGLTAPVARFDTMTGIDDARFSTPVGPETSIQDPSKAPAPIAKDAYSAYNPYGTTATTTTRQYADSFIDAPRTDSIVSSANQAEYNRLADASALFNREKAFGDMDTPTTNLGLGTTPPAFELSGRRPSPTPTLGTPGVGKPAEVNPYVMPLTPTPSAGKYAYAKDRDYKFDPLKTAKKATEEALKFTPSMDYDPNAYTGSGLNDTIAKGGKIAGKTSVEGVVENPNKPGYVSRVSIPTSGDDINVTVFKDSTGNLYAKNYMGTMYSVVPDKKSPSGYKADLTSEYKGPGDAQKPGIVDTVTSKFKNITSPFRKKPDSKKSTTKTPINVSEKSTSTPTYSEASPAIGGFTGYTGDFGAPDKDPTGYGGTGGYGMFNQGGLAAKKPKKKTTRKYKKGGLATSKK